MKSFLAIFFLAILGLVNSYQQLTSPTPTTAEMFPYHAVIESYKIRCTGAIISYNFVLTGATCVLNKDVVNIYLGFTRNPKYQYMKGPIFQAEQIYRVFVVTKTVRPIPIASPDDFLIPPGTYINQTGFLKFTINTILQYATVKERDSDLCSTFYGNTFISHYEGCVKHKRVKQNMWIGPYVINGVLIGLPKFNQSEAICHVASPPCDTADLYMPLERSLLWIFRVSGVAGDNGRKLFLKDNPFWKPEKIKLAKMQSIQKQCSPTPNDSVESGRYYSQRHTP